MKKHLLPFIASLFLISSCGETTPSVEIPSDSDIISESTSDIEPISESISEELTITKIEVKNATTEFEYGADFVFDGVLMATYSNNRHQIIPQELGYVVDSSEYNKDVPGVYQIYVTYLEFSCSYQVRVKNDDKAKRLEVSGYKTNYVVGEPLDFNGKVVAYFNDGTSRELNANEYEIDRSKFASLSMDLNEVTIKYQDLSYTYEVTKTKRDTIKLLMIGNSFSDDTIEYTYNIAKSLGYDEEDICFANLFIGGCTIDLHVANISNDNAAYEYRTWNGTSWDTTYDYKISDAIDDNDWEFISVQQASGSSGVSNSYSQLKGLAEYCLNNSNASVLFNMTWAYQSNSTHSEFYKYNNSQSQMYNDIVNCMKTRVLACKNAEGQYLINDIIPCGTAIQNLRTSFIGDTLTRDGYHLSIPLGRYVAGSTLISALSGYDPSEISYTPTSFTLNQKNAIDDAIRNAIKNKYEVTESSYKEDKIDLTNYHKLSYTYTTGAYYNSSVEKPSYLYKGNDDFSCRFCATQLFYKNTLPNGAIICIKKGYQYRPDAWVDENTLTPGNSRPGNVTIEYALVDNNWWGNYSIIGFNISRVDGNVIRNDFDNIPNIFEIYLPNE